MIFISAVRGYHVADQGLDNSLDNCYQSVKRHISPLAHDSFMWLRDLCLDLQATTTLQATLHKNRDSNPCNLKCSFSTSKSKSLEFTTKGSDSPPKNMHLLTPKRGGLRDKLHPQF